MEIVINFLLGLSASLIAAMFLMYIVFYIWKPKIEISKFIVKTKTSTGQTITSGQANFDARFTYNGSLKGEFRKKNNTGRWFCFQWFWPT